ncbi:hypothetical protein RB195_002581 [Necator americanus]|uniref:Uncharacterized protein n=1 Tax=Necator americanus TaxID=51031 RepID=A0ABR1DJQ2_NECAM
MLGIRCTDMRRKMVWLGRGSTDSTEAGNLRQERGTPSTGTQGPRVANATTTKCQHYKRGDEDVVYCCDKFLDQILFKDASLKKGGTAESFILKTKCLTVHVATNPFILLNESHLLAKTGIDRVFDAKTKHVRRHWLREDIRSVTVNRTAIDAMELCSVREATVMVELNPIRSIMDRPARFKRDILVDRMKVPNRHVVSYTFSSAK